MFLMTTSFVSNPVHRDVASGGGRGCCRGFDNPIILNEFVGKFLVGAKIP